MSDSLRVRLIFKKFLNTDLKNSFISFRKNETKDVKSLKKLIKKRFNLKQKFDLKIDDFVLETREPIDIVRDNDMIEIEAESDFSAIKVKNEPKVKSEPNVKTEPKVKSEPKEEFKSQEPIEKSHKRIPKDNEFKNKKQKTPDTPVVHKSESQVGNRQQSGQYSANSVPKPIKSTQKTYSKTKLEIEFTPQTASMRDIPVRKAFQSATLKFTPQFQLKPLTSGPPKEVITASTSETPKRRKKATREATEPVDRFSPIVILDRILITPEQEVPNHSNQSKGQQKRVDKRTQSARKSFPIRERNKPIDSNNNSNNKTEETPKKGIDFNNCEPLATIPNVGDIIAFKMLTTSSDGNGYECSLFKMASVLDVNKDTQMVDVLLKDVMKRNNLTALNENEQLFGIHSLKINWTTILEPKLIQSHSEPDLLIL